MSGSAFSVTGTNGITQINTGDGLTGGPITETGTVSAFNTDGGLDISNTGINLKLDSGGTLSISGSGLTVVVNNLDGGLTVTGNGIGLQLGSYGLSIDGSNNINVSAAYQRHQIGTISNAQFLALYTNPFQIIPAQGSGTLIVVDYMIISPASIPAVAYGGGGDLYLQYTSNSAQIKADASQRVAQNLIPQQADGCLLTIPNGFSRDAMNETSSGIGINQGVYLTNSGSNYDSGDYGMNYQIWYKVVPYSYG